VAAVFSLRAPSAAAIARLLADQTVLPFSYDGVGATASGALPSGYRHDRWEIDLGPDDGTRFARCVEAVLKWAPQNGAAIDVHPDRPVERDLTFVLVIALPVGFAAAAGRVVYVVDTPDAAGFAYGTLPAHPEQGEEAFVIRRRESRVQFEVVAFSRPRHRLARLGGPVTRVLQLRTNNKYLDVIRRIATRLRRGGAGLTRRRRRAATRPRYATLVHLCQKWPSLRA
jgi:uncharacterized protein (UPF0548 family)